MRPDDDGLLSPCVGVLAGEGTGLRPFFLPAFAVVPVRGHTAAPCSAGILMLPLFFCSVPSDLAELEGLGARVACRAACFVMVFFLTGCLCCALRAVCHRGAGRGHAAFLAGGAVRERIGNAAPFVWWFCLWCGCA